MMQSMYFSSFNSVTDMPPVTLDEWTRPLKKNTPPWTLDMGDPADKKHIAIARGGLVCLAREFLFCAFASAFRKAILTRSTHG